MIQLSGVPLGVLSSNEGRGEGEIGESEEAEHGVGFTGTTDWK